MSPSIGILVVHFGTWPEWSDLFFETARRNRAIDFLVVTDNFEDRFSGPNIRVQTLPFEEYVARARAWLRLPFDPPNAYKLCDLRPMFGAFHEEDFRGYDFYGWCDTDILLGNIRETYTDAILGRYDVLSTHSDRISGHFALFRNTPRNRNMYRHIYRWQQYLLEPEFVGIDEHGITHAYTLTIFDKANQKFGWSLDNPLLRLWSWRRRRRLYLQEQYTTPFTPIPWFDGSVNSAQPDEWIYRNGQISNTRDGDRAFMYLHLMNFKSSRWRHDGTPAPWRASRRCVALRPMT